MPLIIYQNTDGTNGLILPLLAEGSTVADVALKDVPVGCPFLIVDESEMPSELQYHEAWDVDFSDPDGVGLGYDGWRLAGDPTYEG